MKLFRYFLTIMLVTSIGYVKAYAGGAKKPEPGAHDTTINLKSNIVIFKMIPSPVANPNTNGSLKKAGKVARTSSPHTSLENILNYKKKGI